MTLQRTKISYFLPIALTWFCLMGIVFTLKYLISTLIVLIIVYLIAAYLRIIPKKTILKPTIILYLCWLLIEIIKASLNVMKVIWRINLNLKPKLEWIDSNQKNDLGTTIYANSITLTPGTLTIDTQNGKILVHALDQPLLYELKESKMAKKISNFIC